MWYEINVSKDGKHYFATDKRSITTLARALDVRERLKMAMPEEEGFEYTITHWNTVGIQISN
jgi:hypothetical protein